MEETKMRGGAEREIGAVREGGIGFDTNNSIQQSRKVEMRKGEETDLMKRNQALNKEGGEELVARSLGVSVYCRGWRVISSC